MIVLNDMYGLNKFLIFVFDFNFSVVLGVI